MEIIRNLPLQYPLNLIEGQKEQEKFMCVLSRDKPHIVVDPVQIRCGHVVCKHCLERRFINQGAFRCSGTSREPCGEMIDSTQSSFVDQCLKREIKDLVVTCKYGGCQWRGTYVNFREKHVASCELGRSHFLLAAAEGMKDVIDGLTEENKKLKIEAAGNQQTITQLGKDLALRDSQIVALTEANNQVKTKAAEKDPRVTKLESDLLDRTRQIQSLEEIIKMLTTEPQASQSQVSEAPTSRPRSPQSKSKPPQNPPSAKAVGKVREKASSGVHTTTITFFEDDIFSENAAGAVQKFEVGGIKAMFYLGKFGHYDSISLYCKLLESTSWPCTKSATFTIEDINGKTDNDLCRTIHFPRGPARCREKPGNEDCLAVGFTKFCSERILSRTLRSSDPNFFDRHGNCEVKITVRDTHDSELIGPGLELPLFSQGLLHWPVKEFSLHVRGFDSSKKRFSSPPFKTAQGGCALTLELDAGKSNFPGSVTAQVKLCPNNKDFRSWPLKGYVTVMLLDYNPKTHFPIERVIPVEFDNPAKGIVCGRGKGESEAHEFFKLRHVISHDNADEPLYRLERDDEILVQATFLPV